MIVLVEKFANEINYVDGMYGYPVGTTQYDWTKDKMMIIGDVISLIAQHEDIRVSFIEE